MRRKMLCLVLLMILLTVLQTQVWAASGTIRVNIGGMGEVTVYKVGKPEEEGHRLSETYGGGFVTYDDILSPDLAAWLAQRAKGGISRETRQGTAVFTGLEEGLYLVVQTGQREGYYNFSSFLVNLPWDGTLWEIDASPKMEQIPSQTPQTGDGIGMSLGMLVLSLTGLMAMARRKRY